MKRIVVLSQLGGFSGIDGPLVRHLSRRAATTLCQIPPMSSAHRLLDLMLSVCCPVAAWKRRFASRQARQPKDVASFLARTTRAERLLDPTVGRHDVVLQISALFAPGRRDIPIPYALYIDMTATQAVHDYPPWAPSESERHGWCKLEESVYRGAARILTANAAAARSVCDDYGVPAERVVEVGTGFDPMPASARQSPRSRRLLVVSNDLARHGGPAILQVYRGMRHHFPDLALTVVGSDVHEEGVESHAMLNRVELQEAYERACMLLNLGPVGGAQAALEAMACGCVPVALARNPHLGRVVSDHGIALMSADPAVAGAVLSPLLADERRLRERADACRTAAFARHTWEVVVGRIDQELDDVVMAGHDSALARPQR